MSVNASKAGMARRRVGAGGVQKPPPPLWLRGADGAIVAFRAGRAPL